MMMVVEIERCNNMCLPDNFAQETGIRIIIHCVSFSPLSWAIM